MLPVLMGQETEYAVAAPGFGTPTASISLLLDKLVAEARALPHVRRPSGGVFLETGGLFYSDCGHPEYSTPECPNPDEALTQLRIGDWLVDRLARSLQSHDPAVDGVWLSRCNVDHWNMTSWGAHESYLHARSHPPHDLLQTHLATRIIYTGAGGFAPDGAGLCFSISPRVGFLVSEQSGNSLRCRGLTHTKDESHCGDHPLGRLHLICGESLCSDLASWLKMATTALLVRLIEAGVDPIGPVLRAPLAAMKLLDNYSHRLDIPLSTRDGFMSAIGIQRGHLEQVEARLGSSFLPEWSEIVCQRWRATLDKLERAPQELDGAVDWRIKRLLFAQMCQEAGFDPARISLCHGMLLTLKPVLTGSHDGLRERWQGWLAQQPEVIQNHVPQVLAHAMRRAKLDWGGLPDLLSLRARLHEVDKRFGQLGRDGIFNSLDRSGVLDHRLPGIGVDGRIALVPPSSGRGRLRGRFVGRVLWPRPYLHCDWSGIVNLSSKCRIPLEDPFADRERWIPLPPAASDAARP